MLNITIFHYNQINISPKKWLFQTCKRTDVHNNFCWHFHYSQTTFIYKNIEQQSSNLKLIVRQWQENHVSSMRMLFFLWDYYYTAYTFGIETLIKKRLVKFQVLRALIIAKFNISKESNFNSFHNSMLHLNC